MGQKLQGFIIRKYRQERKWSQSSLCRGICAVSYLSKIEQGKAEGSPEVLTLLFRRLGIPWREDPAFCREAGAWLEECYDRLFSGENMGRVLEVLREREEAYCSSPFLLDWLLLSWAMTGESKVELKDFVPAMDARQLSLYLCLEGRFQELLRISGRSYFYLEAGKHAYWKGDYSYAVLPAARRRPGRTGGQPAGDDVLPAVFGKLLQQSEPDGTDPGAVRRCRPDGPHPGSRQAYADYRI